jgi:hypothetical protein
MMIISGDYEYHRSFRRMDIQIDFIMKILVAVFVVIIVVIVDFLHRIDKQFQ